MRYLLPFVLLLLSVSARAQAGDPAAPAIADAGAFVGLSVPDVEASTRWSTLRERGVDIVMGTFPAWDGVGANFLVRDNAGNVAPFFGRSRSLLSPVPLHARALPAVALPAVAQDSSEAWVEDGGVPLYFAVLVEDVDRSVTWYRTVFGLDGVGGSEAENGSWRIENLKNERLFVEVIRDDRAGVVERPRGFSKVGFEVPDVEAVADRVGRATGERPRVLDFARYGVRVIQLRDPDGNIIQLSSPIPR